MQDLQQALRSLPAAAAALTHKNATLDVRLVSEGDWRMIVSGILKSGTVAERDLQELASV
jgi:hypothetical protein